MGFRMGGLLSVGLWGEAGSERGGESQRGGWSTLAGGVELAELAGAESLGGAELAVLVEARLGRGSGLVEWAGVRWGPGFVAAELVGQLPPWSEQR
jgi:hypothetical protein